MNSWLITGGCGFIGTALIKNLVDEEGHHIRIVDDLSVGTRSDLARACRFVETSPSELSQISDLAAGDSRPGVYLAVGNILDPELAHGTVGRRGGRARAAPQQHSWGFKLLPSPVYPTNTLVAPSV